MKLAILGGSFNPIHIGHLYLADAVLAMLNYDRIILVPTFQSPFKVGAEGASPQDRMEMLAASIPGDPRLTLDDCEIRRQGLSFTIDTIHQIIERYKPCGKPGLILGDDIAATFDQWQKPDEIAELVDFIIAGRLADTQAGKSALAAFAYKYTALDNEIINVSSRMVREKISASQNWRYLVPSGARYLIEDRSLYGFSRTASKDACDQRSGNRGDEHNGKREGERGGTVLLETITKVENYARSVLSPARFLHSRNTALMAWDLCQRFGLDAQKGYLAGIAHDICKRASEKDLVRLAHADGSGSTKVEKEKPGLLHGRAAAVLVKRKYGISDHDVLEAIRCHTTGSRDMGQLAKAVYIADKIEVSRVIDSELRELSMSADLDTLFKAVFDSTVAHLVSRDVNLSAGTKKLLAAMQKRNSL